MNFNNVAMTIEQFFTKNTKWVIIVLFVLFMFKTIQSCNRNMSIRTQEKKLTTNCDSLISIKNDVIYDLNNQITSLKDEILTRDFMIKDLTNELRIAGVKVDEAQRRADAIQKTASSIKTNTTIEVKGVDKENSKNEQ